MLHNSGINMSYNRIKNPAITPDITPVMTPDNFEGGGLLELEL